MYLTPVLQLGYFLLLYVQVHQLSSVVTIQLLQASSKIFLFQVLWFSKF